MLSRRHEWKKTSSSSALLHDSGVLLWCCGWRSSYFHSFLGRALERADFLFYFYLNSRVCVRGPSRTHTYLIIRTYYTKPRYIPHATDQHPSKRRYSSSSNSVRYYYCCSTHLLESDAVHRRQQQFVRCSWQSRSPSDLASPAAPTIIANNKYN